MKSELYLVIGLEELFGIIVVHPERVESQVVSENIVSLDAILEEVKVAERVVRDVPL